MPYRHFSDLVSSPDHGTAASKPLKDLIEDAEAAASLARRNVSSGRLDYALEAYIKGESAPLVLASPEVCPPLMTSKGQKVWRTDERDISSPRPSFPLPPPPPSITLTFPV